MSDTLERQGGLVQLEQSDMRLALNMAKMAKEGFLHATTEGTQRLIKEPSAKVRDEKKQGVVSPGLNKLKAVIERHLAMVRDHQMDGCLTCQNGTSKNPQTLWRRKGTGAPPPRPAPPTPGTSPAPSDDTERTQSSETEGVPPRYVYIHTPLPSANLFNLDSNAKDRMRDNDIIPDLLSHEGPSSG